MAPSLSKEELMRNTDSVIWNFNGVPSSPKIDTAQRICDKIWTALNSRVCNVVIVIFVFAEGIVVLSELLINLGIVQDPEWKERSANCTQNSSILPNESSPKMKKAKDVFTYCSLSFLSLFVFEIILRIITGKSRFIVQGVEVFDAIIVLIAFGLDVTFYIAPTKKGVGKESALLIILLRLWRINSVLQSIIRASKAKLGSMIHAYQKDKIQSDHKVDLLILKVEDLEHEVAYLKEKLKKAEKEPLFLKRRRTKDGSSNSVQKPNSIIINIEPNLSSNISSPVTETCSIRSHSPVVEVKLKDKVITYAENAAAIIVDEALLLACHVLPSDTLYCKMDGLRSKATSKLRRRPEGSIESGYGSAAGSINWNKVRENFRTDESKPSIPLNAIKNSLKCPESSPESGYGSGGSAHNPRSSTTSSKDTEIESADLSSGHLKQSSSVFLFPDASEKVSEPCDVQLEVLDEVTEIERVKHVEFDPYQHDKDIPMTSL